MIGHTLKVDHPTFIFSIDMEMSWGPTEQRDKAILKGRAKEDREAIKRLLDITRDHAIPATWAIVGHLFLQECDKFSCLTAKNREEHGYTPEWYHDPHSDIVQHPLYYAADIIPQIISDATQHEIAYHSFSHPDFFKITRDMAEGEVAWVKRLRDEWGIKMESFVFPQNHVDHIDLLVSNDFKIFRSYVMGRSNGLRKGVLRLYDIIRERLSAQPVMPIWRNGIWEIPASMYFCDPFFPRTLLPRSRRGLEKAIARNEIFHIYLHPWSLLEYDELASDVDKFLEIVASKRDQGQIAVRTMAELADELNDLKIQ